MSNADILFLPDASFPMKVKLSRIARGWRQPDLAYHATHWLHENGYRIKVQTNQISWLEMGRGIHSTRKRAVCAVLGIESDRD
jgi:hypothetical protein